MPPVELNVQAVQRYEKSGIDFVAYWDLLADNAMLIGDDYISWPGVTQAANEF